MSVVKVDKKCSQLLDHILSNHKEVYDIHKENTDGVGFRIEFLNMTKDDEDPNSGPLLEAICSTEIDVAHVEETPNPAQEESDTITESQIVRIITKKKPKSDNEYRKRSWVWKYFSQLSNIIFSCNICNVVLSIKGCNTNNMNRHVRTRHPAIYKMEVLKKCDSSDRQSFDLMSESEVSETIDARIKGTDVQDRELDENLESSRGRRSWVWAFFEQKSSTQAECKLCNRKITHGGNATGNMNRHIKMLHNDVFLNYVPEEKSKKADSDKSWIWKVFSDDDDQFHSCKICQYQCAKMSDRERNEANILQHLKTEHGVVSGDQIITSADCGEN